MDTHITYGHFIMIMGDNIFYIYQVFFKKSPRLEPHITYDLLFTFRKTSNRIITRELSNKTANCLLLQMGSSLRADGGTHQSMS